MAQAGQAFRFDPPRKLQSGQAWEWTTLTHALIFGTNLFKKAGPQAALRYFEIVFPADFSVSHLDALAGEALAEIVNLWGVCHRRMGAYVIAIELFGKALQLTQRTMIQQYALYNCGFARLLRAIAGADARGGTDTVQQTSEWLRQAVADLEQAVRLDTSDAAAWAQLATANLLLGSLLTLRVGKRLSFYARAEAAYDQALAIEPNEDEHAKLASNRQLASAGVALLSKVGWLRRIFGTLAEAPSTVRLEEAMAQQADLAAQRAHEERQRRGRARGRKLRAARRLVELIQKR